MSCASCAMQIENEVSKISGVSKSNVNYALKTAQFEIKDLSLKELINKKIIELGYHYNTNRDIEEKADHFKKFLIAITLSIIIFLFEMGPLKALVSQRVNWLIQLVLAFPVWIWIGLKFQKSLYLFLKSFHSNMNTLIGLGTTSAYVYSSFITLLPELSISIGLTQKVYFEAVGFIISFVFLGQYLEEKAKKKTKEALNALFQLSSKKANKLENGDIKSINIEKIKVGDNLRVLPGEKFAVDGVVIKGSSNVDESMITGEPIPVPKNIGDKVYSGTINEHSVIDFKAQKIGSDTFLNKIIAYVEKAQSSKPEIQKFADKVSSIFTPIVIFISILTFLVWFFAGPDPIWGYSISNMIAVLVIACPCALGLATPTAVVVATGRASLKGLLIGGGEVIEKAESIDTIIFDKTGTLTEGKPQVIANYDISDEILSDIASIEQFSEHSLSQAIINYAKEKNLELDEPDSFNIVKGKGIEASINQRNYLIGNNKLLLENNVIVSKSFEIVDIGSYVFVAVNNEYQGLFVIGDKVKEDVKDTISTLKEKGIQCWMVTGDNEEVAKNVCKKVGIDFYMAGVLPVDKASKVEQFQKEGRKVAMIGDGINDAPALARADLSMAMGQGTDVAINTSDVIIVKGDLNKINDFLILAKESMKIIRQNLFLSMIYNSLLIPIAAGVLYLFNGPLMPPILASIAMALSSISVVSNSLRIKRLI